MSPISSLNGQVLAALPERSGRTGRGRSGEGTPAQALLPAGRVAAQGTTTASQTSDPLLARRVVEPSLLSRQDAPASRRGALMMYALTQGASPSTAGARLDIRV